MKKILSQIFKEQKVNLLPEPVQSCYLKIINPVVNFLIKVGVHPNWLTTFGLIFSFVSAIILAKGYFFWGGIFIIIAGTCDLMDGKVARATGRGSTFGAIYDSSLDRYSEVMMFFGACFYFVKNDMYITSIVVFVAVSGSLLVSYIRARSEGLGLQCRVGLMQRTERIVFLAVGALFGDITFVFPSYPISLIIAIWIIAFFANFTAIQRLYHVWKETQNEATRIEEETTENKNN